MPLAGKTIILGVTGGIAAYKSADICSRLIKSDASVRVIMTDNAQKFVGPATFRALTRQQVITSLWDEPNEYEITHISLPDKADAFIIAPATANIIGKIANGIADDMLTTAIMATTAPVIIAPAMNTKMWQNPILQENISKLMNCGYKFILPETGRLACGTIGTGKMAEPVKIVKYVTDLLSTENDFENMKIIITAGPTAEPIDPVRFIMNRSSGKMGYALAYAAMKRSAKVILISGPSSVKCPDNVEIVKVNTAREMFDAVMKEFDSCDILIGAAAPADFTPVNTADEKIKKNGENGLTVELKQTADIMAEAGKRKSHQILAAFAAETENLTENAREKLIRKNADLIVANDVSRKDIGFGSDENETTIICSDGEEFILPKISKSNLANEILNIMRDKFFANRK